MKNVKLTVKKAKDQDQKAFNELFNYHWGYLYNFQLKKRGIPNSQKKFQSLLSPEPLTVLKLSMINLSLKPGY